MESGAPHSRPKNENVPLMEDGEADDSSTLVYNASCISRFKGKRSMIIASVIGAVIVISLTVVLAIVFSRNSQPDSLDAPTILVDFMQRISAQQIRSNMQEFSALPHIAGSPNDKLTANRTHDLFTSFGLKARIEEVPVMLTLPVSRLVEVVYPPELVYNCTLKEPVVNDTTSGVPGAVDTWNGWSGSGEATAELVYANYGREEDFEAIKHVNLTGLIVIMRYGKIFRANKAGFAMARGAAGVLIYIDPEDTGYLRGPAYPDGPWSTNETVQRGTVWLGNGDPTTPGWPSVKNGPRYNSTQLRNPPFEPLFPLLPTIPIQPLSIEDARHLLMGLSGGQPLPDPSWAGGFNLSTIGPGTVKVHMKVEVNYSVTPIWNVFGSLEGEDESDKYVMIGVHRDAWTFGAADPISGHSVMLEVARAIGQLHQAGFKPRRSILFCSWDAEEYGLIGSIEFMEKNIVQLTNGAVVYFNLDTTVEGNKTFHAKGTPSLYTLVKEIAEMVIVAPENSSTTVSRQANPEDHGADHTVWSLFSGTFGFPSDGSDDGGLALFAGIPSMNQGMSDNDGQYESVYHSNYDSLYWMDHFGDPGFGFHAAMAKVYGAMALRIATEVILPFDFVDYGRVIHEQIVLLENATRVDCERLKSAALKFKSAAEETQKEAAKVKSATSLEARRINDKYLRLERGLLDPNLSGRPYYRHVLWTPSLSDSYAGSAFLAVYSAASAGQLDTAQLLADRIALLLDGVADYLKPTNSLL